MAWLVIACDTTAASLKTLYNFDSAPSLIPSLTLSADGSIYGVTVDGGGDFGRGFLFRVDPAGRIETLLSFDETNQISSYMSVLGCSALWLDEAESVYWFHDNTAYCRTKNGEVRTVTGPSGRSIIQLAQGRDNSLYAIVGPDWTTWDYSSGFVRINTDAECEVLGSFDYPRVMWPLCQMTLAHDGSFLGTSTLGYRSTNATFFRVTTNGEVTVLAELTSPAAVPWSWVEAGDGMFYGISLGNLTITGSEFIYDNDSILRFSTNGTLTKVVELEGMEGFSASAQLAAGPDGAVYGALGMGVGGDGLGSIFRLDTNGSLTTVYSFDGVDLEAPTSVQFLQDGSMVGTTQRCGSKKQFDGAVFRLVEQRDVTAMAGFPTAFGYPDSPLVECEPGVFFGATPEGGALGFGVIYQITSTGTTKTVAEFSYTNGAAPKGGLTLAPNGSFYGVTGYGGSGGRGTVFHMTREGVLTTLVAFDGTNGGYPQGPPVFGRDGALYGTTGTGLEDWGSVYRLETNGRFAVIARFGGTNGAFPEASLALGTDGAFYGTTSGGGASGLGGVFRVTTEGELTVIASFVDGDRGGVSGLVLGDDGAFYGVAYLGGNSCSTIFRVTTDGALSTIYTASGLGRLSPISKGLDGRFYGVMSSGDDATNSVFCVDTNGVFKKWSSWPGARTSQPSFTIGGVTLGSDGVFYGVMANGGTHFGGTVFKFDLSTLMQPPLRTWDGWTIAFDGIPGDDHRILRAPQPQGPWTEVANVVAGEDGTAQWTDPLPLSSNAFYRVVSP